VSGQLEKSIKIKSGNVILDGDLTVPQRAEGVVLFAHGSGSSRLSTRNRYVARELNKVGLATLLMDLLTVEEEELDVRGQFRFDIDLLAGRLINATEWLRKADATRNLLIGYFGASTGAAAALVAAAQLQSKVQAVVSRGGRPDLAMAYLPAVKAPTLLIVGGADDVVIELNKKALAKLKPEKKMEIVPGATHLFEEPGTLEAVAELAADWFRQFLHRAQKS
jgi:putative phosphoribosyl transferase